MVSALLVELFRWLQCKEVMVIVVPVMLAMTTFFGSLRDWSASRAWFYGCVTLIWVFPVVSSLYTCQTPI